MRAKTVLTVPAVFSRISFRGFGLERHKYIRQIVHFIFQLFLLWVNYSSKQINNTWCKLANQIRNENRQHFLLWPDLFSIVLYMGQCKYTFMQQT